MATPGAVKDEARAVAAVRDPAVADSAAPPVVSVVIPVWNVEPYLRACLDSVVSQTIGLERLEVVAVDDGSTDGSGAILGEYAARHPEVIVVHEPNSGGPGRPRNIGLDRASGRYVFFLDADDYLGPEALERLVAMAEANGTDIVLAKMVGLGGRPVPTRAFRRNRPRASIGEVYSTLTVLKLFRRALIERIGLRFAEGVAGGEDGPFTARAYLEAGGISIVADYDCYYCRSRPGSQTRGGAGRKEDYPAFFVRISDRMELVARYRPPGPGRDRLMSRHILDVVRPFTSRWLALPPEERRAAFDAAALLIARWHTELIQRHLPPFPALRAYCLSHGLLAELEAIAACPPRRALRDPIVEGSRIFARYPGFRGPARIPDRYFEITTLVKVRRRVARVEIVDGVLHLVGEAHLALLGGSTSVVLRRWPRGPEVTVATSATPSPHLRDRMATYPMAGFTASIDLAVVAGGGPLPAGSWDVLVSVGTDQVRRIARLRAPRGGETGVVLGSRCSQPARSDGGTATRGAVLYATPARRVRLRIGPRRPVTRALELAEAAISRPQRLVRRARRQLRRVLRVLPVR